MHGYWMNVNGHNGKNASSSLDGTSLAFLAKRADDLWLNKQAVSVEITSDETPEEARARVYVNQPA